jgi:arylsulfatase A-like enzyme
MNFYLKNTFPVIFITLLVLITSMQSALSFEKNQKPNILFIAVDDLKPVLGCYGDTIVKTPNIDRFAKEAFVFKNNHCQQAVCAPSRASLLTGKRPDFTMVWNLKTQIRDMVPNIKTIPQLLRENGYETAAVGKVFDVRSVDEKHDSLSWSVPHQKINRSNPKGGGWIFSKERISTEAPNVPDSETIDGEVLLKGKKLIDKMVNRQKPFFLAVGFHKPHLPFVAPKKYWDLYNRDKINIHPFREHAQGTPEWAYQPGWEIRSLYTDIPKEGAFSIEKQKELIHGYYACVSFIDQQIGELIDHLKNEDSASNTIVVLWGDHGWHLGDHGMWCKHSNFEQATRSPLIISGGLRQFRGSTSSPTEFVDIFPTLFELSGIPLKDSLDGKSLVPIMENRVTSVKEYAVSQFHRQGSYMGYAFRDKRYRYVVWLKNNFRTYMSYKKELEVIRELYDYKTDPNESINLIDNNNYKDVVKRFENYSVNYFIDQEKSFYNRKTANNNIQILH